MEKWRTEQDSLFNWKISSGSSSPKAQWLIAGYSGDEEKADELEERNFLRSGRKQVSFIYKSL